MAHKNTKNTSSFKPSRRPSGSSAQTAGPLGTKPTDSAAKPARSFRAETIYSRSEANDRLYDIFHNHEMGHITHAQREKLAHFYELLMQEQEHNNFTRLLKFRDVAIKHFIDCLIVPQQVKLQFPLLDVGTGPGFPGIPLKILFPREKILLAEGVQKRVSFLKKVREDLTLPNLEIIGRNIQSDFMYPVQGVITRAVEEVANTLANVQHSLQLGGCVYFMKGPNAGIELARYKAEWREIYDLEKEIDYVLPKSPHERKLLVFRKIKNVDLPDEDE